MSAKTGPSMMEEQISFLTELPTDKLTPEIRGYIAVALATSALAFEARTANMMAVMGTYRQTSTEYRFLQKAIQQRTEFDRVLSEAQALADAEWQGR
jgi:hypothetical protein